MSVVCFVDDLLFVSKIRNIARSVGIEVEFVPAQSSADRVGNMNPSIVIIDLESAKFKPLDLIAAFKTKTKEEKTLIIGFLSHVNTELFGKAQDAGCRAMPRSKFLSELSVILKGAK